MTPLKLLSIPTFLCCIFLFGNCSNGYSQDSKNDVSQSKEFRDYWFSGKAELSRFELEQARYGEIHKGEAVLIFVSEDFLGDKQVKYERGERKNVVPTLKLNFTKKFFTGIYPYSMMSSIFTPIDFTKPTMKVTTSSQEWCGHTFTQLNHRKGKYKGQLFSYFQSEGDENFSLEASLLEDEIWNKIRLNPESLPTGEIKIIPGTQFLRLKHRPTQVENATAGMVDYKDETLSQQALKKYKIEYKGFDRVLEITFEAAFPYSILAWEEQTQSGFRNPQTLTTRAVRTHSIKSAYWGKNSLADGELRKKLGLNAGNY